LQDGNDQPQLQNALLRDRSATGCLYEQDVRRYEQDVRRYEQDVRRYEQDVRLYEQDVPSTDATHRRDATHSRDATHMKAGRYEQGVPNTTPLVMLSVDRFVSGRFDEVWLASSHWARPQ
jgi:hypothetical protein